MRYLLFVLLLVCFQTIEARPSKIGLWSIFERELIIENNFTNPFTQTELKIEFERPDQTKLIIRGFFNGGSSWKFRVMPDQTGKWKYVAAFTHDVGKKFRGTFECIPSDIPGLISADETNPAWFGFKGGKHKLIRSFHTGDRFFAANWPDRDRNEFLDWLIENKYNMLSVASHLLNRNDVNRGKGWNTPNLWNFEKQQPNPEEYTKMERILDELAARKICVFPFAGFLGQKSNHPTDSVSQSLYISYTISRLGAYWNTLYNVAGPEPLYSKVNQFTHEKVDQLGKMIADQNTQGHLLSVHNEKNHNPLRDAQWATYQCLQGPTTLDTDALYQGLMARRKLNQPLLAQEVLWYGNIYQQTYNDEQLRKNAFTIMMAGAALNFADNAGTSSTGFTGTLKLDERHQDKHEIIKKVWDFFESIPFYELTPSPLRSTTGYTLANQGKTYLTYLPNGGEVSVNTKPGYYSGTWIKGTDTSVRINTGPTDGRNLRAPSDEDWLLYLQAGKAEQPGKRSK